MFDNDAAARIHRSVRRTEGDLVGPDRTTRRIARRRHEPDEIQFVEMKKTIQEGDAGGHEAFLLVRRGEVFERRDTSHPDYTVTVYDSPAGASGQRRGMFRGVAFGYEDGSSTTAYALQDAGAERGDVVAAVKTHLADGDGTRYQLLSPGATVVHGVAVNTTGPGDVPLQVDVTFADGNSGADGRIWRMNLVEPENSITAGQAVICVWDSADRLWRGFALQAMHVVAELETNLVENGGAYAGGTGGADAWVLDSNGDRTAESIVVYGAPWGDDLPSTVGPWRGFGFGATGSDERLRGDVVLAVSMFGSWWALGSGRTAGTGTAQEDIAAGSIGVVLFDTRDSRELEVTVFALCTIKADDSVLLTWNGLEQRWDASLTCGETELTAGCGVTIEDGVISVNAEDLVGPGLILSGECGIAVDPDGECCGSGGDGGGGDGGTPGNDGLPPGVTCDPRVCCDTEDAELSVTDCEEFAAAPERYWIPLPRIVCVPDCATEHEPDEDGNTLDGVYVEHADDSCVWVSETFTCDGSDWYWELTLSADGTSWLRLWKDQEEYLSYVTDRPWCPRCENEVTIHCPPDECHDAPEKLCVKPVCTDCEDGPAFEIDVTAEDAVNTTDLTWQGDDANSGTSEVDAAEGYPEAPSRKVTLNYGTVPANVDGVAVFDEYEDIAFDPENCEVDLTEICLAFLWVKTDIDDSDTGPGSPARGIKWGVGCKQGSNYYVAPLGSSYVRAGNWIKLAGRHLQSTDFHEITATGIDTSSHPDWTAATGTVFTFGIVAYQEDDDSTDTAITAVGHYDRAEIQLAPYECAGDPPAATCPDAVRIVACADGADTDLYTRDITVENTGDTPFNVAAVTWPADFCEFAFASVSTFTGVVPANGSKVVATLTYRITTAKECCDTITIRMTIGGEVLECPVSVCLTVLAEEECDPEEPCELYHHDERDYAASPGTALDSLGTGAFLPSNDGNLTYAAPVACDLVDGVETSVPSGVEFVTGTGLVSITSATPIPVDTAIIQLIDTTSANFAAKAVVNKLNTSGDAFAIGLVFGYADVNDWSALLLAYKYAGCNEAYSYLSCNVVRQRPGEALEHVEAWCSGVDVKCFGLHVVGNLARLVVDDGQSVADGSLLDRAAVDHDFADVVIDNGGTRFGIVYINFTTEKAAYSTVLVGETCITNQPGTEPIWGLPA